MTGSDERLDVFRPLRRCPHQVGDEEPGEAGIVEHTTVRGLPSARSGAPVESRHPAGVAGQLVGIEQQGFQLVSERCILRGGDPMSIIDR